MKKLSESNFRDRLEAIDRARKIFIKSGLTKNISVAFELYQEVLAEKDRPLAVSLSKNKTKSSVQNALVCPLCTKPVRFMAGTVKDSEGQPVPSESMRLVCSNPDCDGLWDTNTSAREFIRSWKVNQPIDFTILTMEGKKVLPKEAYTLLNPTTEKTEISRKKSPRTIPIETPCPECGGKLYKLNKCCGTRDGVIECENCDYKRIPRKANVGGN